MSDPFSFKVFLETFSQETEHPSPDQLDGLVEALSKAEHPKSIRALFWALLRTFERKPVLQRKLMEAWAPTEPELAQLLEDGEKDGARVFVSLRGAGDELTRLWELCDDSEMGRQTPSSDPWTAISRSPMAALEAEQQLDRLITALVQGRRWKDPAEILDPEGSNAGFELESIISLGQSRMTKMQGGSEALNRTMLRLLNFAKSRGGQEL